MYPEMVTIVHRCEKHLVAMMLLNDTFIVVIHEIGKTILCLSRNGCDKCSLHDESRYDVCNLDHCAALVESECARRITGTSRRVSE